MRHVAGLRLDAEIQRVGLSVRWQASRLMSLSRRSGWIAAASQPAGGVGLYMHGVLRALRSEPSLRVCIGLLEPALAQWLATDVLA